MITLYDAARCPYCARVRIVLDFLYDGLTGLSRQAPAPALASH